jgi:tricorn protease
LSGYLRYPAIGSATVVFACEDDLWTVPADGGRANRLTAGVSEASRPRLSPDGASVAFTGADNGPTELYVMPLSAAAGGPPGAAGPARRLTFQAARCATVGWHPRTGEIIYASTAEQPAGFGYRLFAVHPDGGPSRLLGVGPADTLSYGPGGTVVLGRNTADPARWKRYRGGCAGELWTGPGEDGPFERLITLPGNLASPCWAGDRIYFISDHEGTGDVYSCRPDGTGLARHSDHREFYARNLTTDGHRLVYHAGARLHLLDPAPADGTGPSGPTGVPEAGAGTHRGVTSRPLPVELAGARAQCGSRFVPAAEYTDGVRLSPDGTALALTARGKAFTLAPWSGPVRRHGRPDGVRYRLLDWLADGAGLVAVAGDDRPDERLVLLDADGGEAQTELTDGTLGQITELTASPVSGLVAFATSRQQLWTVDTSLPGTGPRLLDRCTAEQIEDLAWSPDGRWLAYTCPDTPHVAAVKIAEAESGRTHRITEPVLRDHRPVFDPAGRYLYFLGQRDLTPEYDQVRFDIGFPFGTRPYLVTLRADAPSPFGPGAAPAGSTEADAPASVEIDLDGITRRVAPLPVPEGRYSEIVALPDRVLLLATPVAAPDPEQSAPTGGTADASTVIAVELDTSEVTEGWFGPVDGLSADPAGGTLLHGQDGRYRVLVADPMGDFPEEYRLNPDPAPGRRTGWVDLDRVRVPLRPAAEWRQMFREAWRLQRESFWDPAMAGVDWDAMYDRYAPLADLVACRSELSDLLWELHGELATSHAYERGGEYRTAAREPQGFLGVDWETTGDRGAPRWRIARVLHGDLWNPLATSPCNRLGADIRAGDTVTAVNGQPVGPAGPGELLAGQAGREVELTLLREDGAQHRVTVRASANEARARYLDWSAANRDFVRAESQGRLGYLHVPDMLGSGYADFTRGFLSELDREGLVIDMRYNSGGHVSPLLLDRLARRQAGSRRGRWSGVAPHPAESAPGPMAVLVNEHTGSDGEIFSHLFRALGLGPLIGRRTWGGVVAIWPRHLLVDGTLTTQPEFRYFLRDVGDLLENHGVEPDYEVDMPPHHRIATDGDRQLVTTVGHLLTELDGTGEVGAAAEYAGNGGKRAVPLPAVGPGRFR